MSEAPRVFRLFVVVLTFGIVLVAAGLLVAALISGSLLAMTVTCAFMAVAVYFFTRALQHRGAGSSAGVPAPSGAQARMPVGVGGAALATGAAAAAVAWNGDDDDHFGAFPRTQSPSFGVNPATGLPMMNGTTDVGGNVFGVSNDDHDHATSFMEDSPTFMEDSSASLFSHDSSADDHFRHDD